MKKILYYSDSKDFGGAEKVLSDVVNGIDRSKYQPVVIIPKGKHGHRLISKLKDVKVYELSRCQIWSRLTDMIRKEGPDIVHLNMHVPFSCFYMIFVLRMLKFRNIIATVHSTIPPQSRSFIIKQIKAVLCRLLLPHVKEYVCVSRASKAEFSRNYNVPEGKIRVVHNAIREFVTDGRSEQAVFKAKKTFGLSEDSIVLGAVGRIEKDKGVMDLLRAMPRVLKVHPRCVCLIAGDGGDYAGSLKKAAKDLGITDKICFAGYVEDIKALYSALDILILPSLHEALPLTVLEAMQAGVPVIASGVGGIPELIEDGVTGSLIRPEDPDAISTSVISMLDDPETTGKMAALGKQRYKSGFMLKDMIDGIESIYNDIGR